ELSPDQPMHYYWFRTERGAPRESRSMDPRLREVSEAFGAGDFERARELAQALLDLADDPTLRSEAASYLTQSHLAQADFEGARAAAQRLNDDESLARITKMKAEYLAEVGRLQRIVARAKDAAEAAQAQLLTAHAHRLAGLLNVAQESYWKVCWRYPNRPEAGRAIREIVNVHHVHGDARGARSVCKMAVDAAPDSDLAVRACEAIYRLSLAHEQVPRQEAREHLRRIAAQHPATRGADTARFGIGELYAAEGEYEVAEGVWASLVAERPQARIASEARVELAELRHALGMQAFSRHEYEKAADWLALLLPDISLVQRAPRGPLPPEAEASERRAYAIFCLGEACQKADRWEEAAAAFEKLATRGAPTEEVALFELVRCHSRLGDHARARATCDRLSERFPSGAYVREARGLL
ncbi:MAG: tetratricopeptide repeat protein, partial [Armatimonadota bacterium]